MPRKRAIDIILRVKRDGAYSNLELASALNGLNASDKAFVTKLVYGTLTYEIQADYLISKHIKKPVSKLDTEVLAILESAVYQKLYMDSVPDYAIINESVNLTRKYGKASAAGFVNAVLRKTLKLGLDITDIPENTAKYYSIKYSLDERFCSLMMKQYGALAETIFSGSRKNAPFTVRVNTLKTDREKLKDMFLSKGIKTQDTQISDFCLKIESGFAVREEELFKNGMYYPQDEASVLAAYALSPREGDTVIDMCAAPGGKTTCLAECMRGTGVIYAFDLYEHKVNIINELCKRLKTDIIKTEVKDASVYDEALKETADKILADCPCSGYGLLRKKPEIKYKSSTKELEALQYRILENAAMYLKTGGELVYSTCTVNKAENIDNINRFLSEHKEFELMDISGFFGGKKFYESGKGYVQILPGEYDMDGFFISKLKKTDR